MTKSRHILAPRRQWTPAEDAKLIAHYPHVTARVLATRLGVTGAAIYNRAGTLGLKKSAAFWASDKHTRIRRGQQDAAMIASRFPAGHVPANKGLRRPGWAPGRMRETQFKPGVRRGVAVKLYQPIGSERTSKDGYRERKINDDMPLQRRWRGVHLLTWEAVNGPVPRGHCLCFRDGDKTHIDLDNLELITRAERMRRNTIHRYPPDLKKAIRLVGKLKRTIGDRNEKQD